MADTFSLNYGFTKPEPGTTGWDVKLNGVIDDIDAEIAAREAESASLQSQISSNDSDIIGLQSQISSNDSDIIGLQSQISSNNSDIIGLQSQISSNDSDISLLQSQLAAVDNKVLLQTVTVGSQANIDLAGYITSAYKKYEIELINLLPANSSEWCNIRVQTGGATWVTTNTYKNHNNATALDRINLDGLFIDNAVANGGLNGVIHISDPAATTKYKLFKAELWRYNGSLFNVHDGGGIYIATTAVTGIRLFCQSGGNWVAGTVKIYGIK